MKPLIPIERIERRIHLIRSLKVMLDRDLANLYGVSAKRLNQAVKRNRRRFPPDFMFQLTKEEALASISLRSQIVTLKRGQHLKYSPYAFTEQGVAMLASVLRSERAINVNIAIVRAFVRLREMLSAHKELASKLAELEGRINSHDVEIKSIFDAIRQWMSPPENPPRQIGFRP